MPTEEIEPGSLVSEDETPTGTFAGTHSPSGLETLSGASFSSGDGRTTIGRYSLLQREGEWVDTRTDVYSLGVVLCELATGVLPFDSKAMRQASLAEIQRRIRKDEPPRPSTRVSSPGDRSSEVAERHQTEPVVLVRCLRGDLEANTMKAFGSPAGSAPPTRDVSR